MGAKLKAAVIGLGKGRAHVKDFYEDPNAEIVAVADLSDELREQMKTQYNVDGLYSDYKEMLEKEDLDIVCIATPNSMHKAMTIDALNADCHVVCEKPMAMNGEEAEEMIKVANEKDKRLMINFSFRFRPQSRVIKDQIEKGILGDIYYAKTHWLRRHTFSMFNGWHGSKSISGGGPMMDLGVHRLDLALWLMGFPKPKTVVASTFNKIGKSLSEKYNKPYEVEDLAAAFIQFENGSAISLESSWSGHTCQREDMQMLLMSTKAGIRQYNLEEGYTFRTEFFTEENGFYFDRTLHDRMPVPDSESPMHHFSDAIVNDKPHISTAEEGLTVTRIIDAIYKSAETQSAINL